MYTSPKDFAGKGLVTGAASGIGAAVAVALAQAGCSTVALLDVNAAGLEITKEAVTAASKATVHCYTCDISSATSVVATFAQVANDFGRIDYAINCAGLGTNGQPSIECEIEYFDLVNSVNYRGLWLCSREELKIMKAQTLDCEAYPDAAIPPARAQRGAIVHIASQVGFVSIPRAPVYCATKAAVVSLTRSDAIDYAADRVRINAVCPGVTLTPMITGVPGLRDVMAQVVEQEVPLKRFGQPEEVADVAVFLCTHKASFVHGATWGVDGGWICM